VVKHSFSKENKTDISKTYRDLQSNKEINIISIPLLDTGYQEINRIKLLICSTSRAVKAALNVTN
jgi:hypothetical protein